MSRKSSPSLKLQSTFQSKTSALKAINRHRQYSFSTQRTLPSTCKVKEPKMAPERSSNNRLNPKTFKVPSHLASLLSSKHQDQTRKLTYDDENCNRFSSFNIQFSGKRNSLSFKEDIQYSNKFPLERIESLKSHRTSWKYMTPISDSYPLETPAKHDKQSRNISPNIRSLPNSSLIPTKISRKLSRPDYKVHKSGALSDNDDRVFKKKYSQKKSRPESSYHPSTTLPTKLRAVTPVAYRRLTNANKVTGNLQKKADKRTHSFCDKRKIEGLLFDANKKFSDQSERFVTALAGIRNQPNNSLKQFINDRRSQDLQMNRSLDENKYWRSESERMEDPSMPPTSLRSQTMSSATNRLILDIHTKGNQDIKSSWQRKSLEKQRNFPVESMNHPSVHSEVSQRNDNRESWRGEYNTDHYSIPLPNSSSSSGKYSTSLDHRTSYTKQGDDRRNSSPRKSWKLETVEKEHHYAGNSFSHHSVPSQANENTYFWRGEEKRSESSRIPQHSSTHPTQFSMPKLPTRGSLMKPINGHKYSGRHESHESPESLHPEHFTYHPSSSLRKYSNQISLEPSENERFPERREWNDQGTFILRYRGSHIKYPSPIMSPRHHMKHRRSDDSHMVPAHRTFGKTSLDRFLYEDENTTSSTLALAVLRLLSQESSLENRSRFGSREGSRLSWFRPSSEDPNTGRSSWEGYKSNVGRDTSLLNPVLKRESSLGEARERDLHIKPHAYIVSYPHKISLQSKVSSESYLSHEGTTHNEHYSSQSSPPADNGKKSRRSENVYSTSSEKKRPYGSMPSPQHDSTGSYVQKHPISSYHKQIDQGEFADNRTKGTISSLKSPNNDLSRKGTYDVHSSSPSWKTQGVQRVPMTGQSKMSQDWKDNDSWSHSIPHEFPSSLPLGKQTEEKSHVQHSKLYDEQNRSSPYDSHVHIGGVSHEEKSEHSQFPSRKSPSDRSVGSPYHRKQEPISQQHDTHEHLNFSGSLSTANSSCRRPPEYFGSAIENPPHRRTEQNSGSVQELRGVSELPNVGAESYAGERRPQKPLGSLYDQSYNDATKCQGSNPSSSGDLSVSRETRMTSSHSNEKVYAENIKTATPFGSLYDVPLNKDTKVEESFSVAGTPASREGSERGSSHRIREKYADCKRKPRRPFGSLFEEPLYDMKTLRQNEILAEAERDSKAADPKKHVHMLDVSYQAVKLLDSGIDFNARGSPHSQWQRRPDTLLSDDDHEPMWGTRPKTTPAHLQYERFSLPMQWPPPGRGHPQCSAYQKGKKNGTR